jgi:ABC-type antimicrobial peptide transport system permease subunit
MKIGWLVIQEIRQRKLNFSLILLSIVVAVALVTSAITLLQHHDRETSAIIEQKEQDTQTRMALLRDDYRKITKELGFNLLILPQDQNLHDLYSDDFASKFMPYDYVDKLAASKSMLIRHLLPSLQQKIEWPEQRRSVVLTGVRGEVPFLHKDPKEPIMVAVPPDHVVVGYELSNSLGISTGDKIRLMGQMFTVSKCNAQRGNKDDITLWIDLTQAQKLLNKPDKINAILALKCHCSGNDLAAVRKEVHRVLPGTQVIEKGTEVLVRAEARDRAAKEASEAVEAEKKHRAEMRAEQEKFASILVPAVLLCCALLTAFLFIANVRDRKSEIGVLRAVGVKEMTIMKLFLYKATVIGLVGALLGFAIGITSAVVWADGLSIDVVNYRLFASVLFVTPVLSVLAAFLPATLAARMDPAEVLKEE